MSLQKTIEWKGESVVVTIEYEWSPADPSVGIFESYPEITHVLTDPGLPQEEIEDMLNAFGDGWMEEVYDDGE